MAGRLEGKVALVTGAGSGIGRATALALAEEGAKVVVSARSVDGGQETVAGIKRSGGEAMFVRADVSIASDVAALVQTTVDRYGLLDCAHNNAGVRGQVSSLMNIRRTSGIATSQSTSRASGCASSMKPSTCSAKAPAQS